MKKLPIDYKKVIKELNSKVPKDKAEEREIQLRIQELILHQAQNLPTYENKEGEKE